jgi:uncharacterized protein (TIGR03083 family)
MTIDYRRLLQQESAALAAYVETLSDEEWHRPSLCRGWRVREVVAHMAAGHRSSTLAYAGLLARARFSTDRAGDVLARRYARDHSIAEIVAAFREGTAGRPSGATRWVKPAELFVDHFVHHQDIRRPLGHARTIPVERLSAALEALPKLSARIGTRARMAGLRVTAEDVSWSHGQGALLRGPAEALIVALTGRSHALADLSGDGAVVLARRLRAEDLAVSTEEGARR